MNINSSKSINTIVQSFVVFFQFSEQMPCDLVIKMEVFYINIVIYNSARHTFLVVGMYLTRCRLVYRYRLLHSSLDLY